MKRIRFWQPATDATFGEWTMADDGTITATPDVVDVLASALRAGTPEEAWAKHAAWSNGYFASAEVDDQALTVAHLAKKKKASGWAKWRAGQGEVRGRGSVDRLTRGRIEGADMSGSGPNHRITYDHPSGVQVVAEFRLGSDWNVWTPETQQMVADVMHTSGNIDPSVVLQLGDRLVQDEGMTAGMRMDEPDTIRLNTAKKVAADFAKAQKRGQQTRDPFGSVYRSDEEASFATYIIAHEHGHIWQAKSGDVSGVSDRARSLAAELSGLPAEDFGGSGDSAAQLSSTAKKWLVGSGGSSNYGGYSVLEAIAEGHAAFQLYDDPGPWAQALAEEFGWERKL